MRKLGIVSTLVLGVVVAGCGGGSSGFSTGVPGNKPLGTLTPAEAKTLCMNALNYLQKQLTSGNFREQQCRAIGVGFASLGLTSTTTDQAVQQACTAGYALCQTSLTADGGITFDNDGGTDSCSTTDIPPTCTATASQYEACVNESFSAANNIYPPCNQLTVAKAQMLLATDGGTVNTSGPACTAFEAACPGLDMSASALRSSALRSMHP